MLGLGISQVDGEWQSVNDASHDDISAAIAAYVAPVISGLGFSSLSPTWFI